MVNINKQIMMEGMRADYHKVDRLSRKVIEIVTPARRIHARTAAGTDFIADLNPDYRWLKTSGIISPDKWGNLPGGEIFTTPGEINGTFVVDGVVGDFLCKKYGLLEQHPLTIQIEKNRIVSCHSDNKELEQDFWNYTHTDENSDRVGEFAIGTNIELKHVIGNILQDEKFPGIHIAFGNPYGEHTGAKWYSSTHIDVVGLQFDIFVDDAQIMRQGQVPHRSMIPELRQRFNRDFTPEKYRRFLDRVDAGQRHSRRVPRLRNAVFLPAPLLEQMTRYGSELTHQLVGEPALSRGLRWFDSRRNSKFPMKPRVPCSCRSISVWCATPDGELEPKLVELQGFPSLYAYQAFWRRNTSIPSDFRPT